jgi:hypothetical protein
MPTPPKPVDIEDASELMVTPPAYRRLRGYSFDPSLVTKLDTAIFAEVTFRVPWEKKLGIGPVGEYVEVVDFDPATGCFYAPVNLNDPNVIAQDGLAPSEGTPQFHQQMVYAVTMLTIMNFERALGRWIFWAPRTLTDEERKLRPAEKKYGREYVQRLRVYPHAMRQANAYYSPAKKALLFGYFPAAREAGGMIFTCLSHDIIAHETTHALLDGMYERFMEPSHPDSRAFHEAFADLVALFQRFGIESVVRNQIAKTRGDIAGTANLLGALAQQFGVATGTYGALRDAIGKRDPNTGAWEPLTPNPQDYLTKTEEHERGAILVAAVFDAFMAIYRFRVADLQRIATGGTGVLPQGELHPDLVNRFAGEAAKVARQFLNMCVRSLDYCPPVDITFGDYLRAMITADFDLVPDDDLGYRVALIEAFRRRGILPDDLRVISEDSLLWDDGKVLCALDRRDPGSVALEDSLRSITEFLRTNLNDLRYAKTRQQSFVETQKLSAALHQVFFHKGKVVAADSMYRLTGIRLQPQDDRVETSRNSFQVYKLRHARRIGPDGLIRSQIVISLLQKKTLQLDLNRPASENNSFTFRGGCTLIFDLDRLELCYAIKKPIDDEARIERQRRYLLGEWGMPERATFTGGRIGDEAEPLALLHGIR